MCMNKILPYGDYDSKYSTGTISNCSYNLTIDFHTLPDYLRTSDRGELYICGMENSFFANLAWNH